MKLPPKIISIKINDRWELAIRMKNFKYFIDTNETLSLKEIIDKYGKSNIVSTNICLLLRNLF